MKNEVNVYATNDETKSTMDDRIACAYQTNKCFNKPMSKHCKRDFPMNVNKTEDGKCWVFKK